jgi:hypothetical protein
VTASTWSPSAETVLDLGAPQYRGPTLVGYRDVDDRKTVHRLPDRVVLVTGPDGLPQLTLTLLTSETRDGGMLTGTWTLAYPDEPREGVDATPVTAWVRLTQVHMLGAERTAQEWQPAPVTCGSLEMPVQLVEPPLAVLLVESIERGSLDGLVALDVAIDTPIRRIGLRGSLDLELGALCEWVHAIIGRAPTTRAILHGALGAFVDRHLGAELDVELDGNIDDVLLREELVLTLLEQSGVQPVVGDLGCGVNDLGLEWAPRATAGQLTLDLGVPRTALLRRCLTASISEELAALGPGERSRLVRRTPVPPLMVPFSLAIANLLPIEPAMVSGLRVRVRRRVGQRFEDLHHSFVEPGAAQVVRAEGRHILGQDPTVHWEAELHPGPGLRAAGVSAPRQVNGAVTVVRHRSVQVDAATFGLDGVTIDVAPAVAAKVERWTAELRDQPDALPLATWTTGGTGGWLACDARLMPRLPLLRVIAHCDAPDVDPAIVFDASIGPLRRVHVTERDLACPPSEVTVELSEDATSCGSLEMVTVTLDAGDQGVATALVLQRGDAVLRWRHPRRSVLAPRSWWWSAQWLLSTPTGRRRITEDRRSGHGDQLVLHLPAEVTSGDDRRQLEG